MRSRLVVLCTGTALFISSIASANLLANGDLDVTYDQEIVPGFFLPKPHIWQNVGNRSISGPYEDEMSSEPWAGPAPTPVTTNGFNVTSGNHTNDDWGVFFKPFSGNDANGLATGHLYQDVSGTPGLEYTLTGWAGGEANALMADAQFAIEFLNASGSPIGGTTLSLMPTLLTPNGQPFQYKFYSLSSVAPAGTVTVRARASMIDAHSNPQGGGQAFVVDDFELNAVPEPATLLVLGAGAAALLRRRRR